MIKIKNWSKFQHFKDRCPPWIKVHRELLDQRDINLISDRCFRVLINLWLLASEDENKNGELPDIQDIAFRLRMKDAEIIEALHGLKDFLIFDDITLISEGYQVDVPETEAETEAESYSEEAYIVFEKFWFEFPKQRRGNKQKAKSAYAKAIKEKRATEGEIYDGVQAYKNSDEVREGYGKGAAAWLNDDRWANNYGKAISKQTRTERTDEVLRRNLEEIDREAQANYASGDTDIPDIR